MRRHRFFIEQLDELNETHVSWVAALLDEVSARHFKTKHYQDWFTFPDKPSSHSFFDAPLTLHHQPVTVKALLREIDHYDSLPWWKKMVYFLFSSKPAFIKKARAFVTFAGIKALFHYKQQIDPLTYRGIKTMLQKHEPKAPQPLGEITRAFFGDGDEGNDKKDGLRKGSDPYEKELFSNNKQHLHWIYQSAKEKLQLIVNDKERFPTQASRQQEWQAIKGWIAEEIKTIEDYYHDDYWDKADDACLAHDWLAAVQADIQIIQKTYEESDLIPLIKRLNAPDIKWQHATGQNKAPLLTIGNNKAVDAHRQLIRWAEAQLPYRPLLPDQASRWAMDKQALLAIFEPLFDEILTLKETDKSLYVAKQMAMAKNLAAVVQKHRLLVEEAYSSTAAKKLLIPFDRKVYEEIRVFFKELAYVAEHVDKVLYQHLKNENTALLENLLHKKDETILQWKKNIALQENINRHLAKRIEILDKGIAKNDQGIQENQRLLNQNAEMLANIQIRFTKTEEIQNQNAEKLAELEENLDQNAVNLNQFSRNVENYCKEANAYCERATKFSDDVSEFKKETDNKLEQLAIQLLSLLDKPGFENVSYMKNELLQFSQQKDTSSSFKQGNQFLLFKSNLTTQTPLPEAIDLDRLLKY